MEQTTTTIACPAAAPDPEPDRPGGTVPARPVPARIAALLQTVRIILGFGRHLAETARQRATTPDFNTIAACFGTGRLSAILAHLQRGMLRATALQNVLLARAARGQDIDVAAPRERATVAPTAAAEPLPGQPAEPSAETSVPRNRRRVPTRPAGWDDPELFMPTLAQLEAEVRRRPLGRTLVDICLDLGVVPGFCTSVYWNQLAEDISWYGGSVAALMQEKYRREQAFHQEQCGRPQSNSDWLTHTRDAVRDILGFFIGEAAEAPTGPPSAPGPLAAAVVPVPS